MACFACGKSYFGIIMVNICQINQTGSWCQNMYLDKIFFFCGDFSYVLSLVHHQDFKLAWNFHSHILTDDDVKKTKSNSVARKRGQGSPGAWEELGQFISAHRWASASLLERAKQAARLSPSSFLSSLLQNPSTATIRHHWQIELRRLKSKQGQCPMPSAFIQMKSFWFCFFNYWTTKWRKWKRSLETLLLSAII